MVASPVLATGVDDPYKLIEPQANGQLTLDLLVGRLHCQSWNRTCRRQLAANIRAVERAANRTQPPSGPE